MELRNVIIDCDTGVDDALALLLALRSPAFNVVGITCVGGNVPLDKVVRNTLVIVEHSGKQVPVYAGAGKALLQPLRTAEYAHGEYGLGDLEWPAPQTDVQAEHAVDYLVRTFMQADEPLHLITLAPLTNVALALMREPRLENRFQSIHMMAGGIAGGNTTPFAEFNVYVDPEAADVVFQTNTPKTMIALDPIMDGGSISAEEVVELEKADTPWCWAAARLLRWQLNRFRQHFNYERPATPPDLAAMGVAIDPNIAEAEMYHVAVETKGEHTRGMTVVDTRWYRRFRGDAPEPNVNTVKRIDTAAYRRLFLQTMLNT